MSSFLLLDDQKKHRLSDMQTLVLALGDVAEALSDIAASIRRLGTADAYTPMGAIEILSEELKNGLAKVAGAVRNEP